MTKHVKISGLLASLFMTTSPALAEEKSSYWTFEAGLYGFIPISVEGDSTVDGGTVGLDLGPDEIFDLLEFAIAGRFVGWRDSGNHDNSAYGFVIDANYVDLGLEEKAGGGNVDVDIRQAFVDVMAGYRFAPVQTNVKNDQTLVFDITGGFRYNYLRQKIEVTPGLSPPFTVNLGGSESWVEPVIGGSANYRLNDKWNFIARGDVSGFGINDSLAWSVTGLAAWRAWDKTTLRFGYRVYDIDYTTGSGASEFGADLTLHGPFLGISYKF